MTFFVRTALCFFVLLPSTASAHILENMGYGTKDMPPAPKFYTGQPIADEQTQRMALDIERTSCEDLLTLDEPVKEAFLLLHMFIQRPGSLSRLVGPDCEYMGPAQEIAAISDPSLTVSGRGESLYYLPEAHVLLVSNKEENSVAYGMFYHGEEPIQHFINHRHDAEQSAELAKVFTSNAPRFAATTSATSRISLSSSSSSAPALSSSVSSELVATSSLSSQAPQALPAIEPLGPEQNPVAETKSNTLIIVLGSIFILIGGVVVFIFIRRRATLS